MFGLFRKRDPNKDSNDKVRKALREHGDGGTVPRHVMHFVYPDASGANNTTVVLDFLVMNGLEVDPSKTEKGYIAEETREVASADFDAHTARLTHAMKQWNWKYDGWECAVVTD
ncbi:MAG: ribonuclease E inhibitor RraB [Pseudomonadota bacterium]